MPLSVLQICASASSTEVDPPAAEPELVDPPMEESEVDPPVAAQPIVPAQNPALNKKLRIRLKSFDVEPMKEAVQMILDVAKNTGISIYSLKLNGLFVESDARVSGPVALPTKRRLYCLLRSPHVDKDSREHFEMRIRSRLIDIRDMKSDTIDQLMALDIPAGVDVNIKIL